MAKSQKAFANSLLASFSASDAASIRPHLKDNRTSAGDSPLRSQVRRSERSIFHMTGLFRWSWNFHPVK